MAEISNFLLGRLLCAHFFDLIFTFIAASNNTAWGSMGKFLCTVYIPERLGSLKQTSISSLLVYDSFFPSYQ